MKKVLLALALALSLLVISSLALGQTVASPQYQVGLNAFGSGVYGNTTAMLTTFGYQISANTQAEADLIAAPTGGVTDYEVGGNYNLCAIKALANLLASTALSCDTFEPFAAFTAGDGHVQIGNTPAQSGLAYLIKFGLQKELSPGTGQYMLEAVGGYGKFGPAIAGQSDQGFVGYLGFSFGGGNNPAATAVKQERFQLAQAKKQANLLKHNKKLREELQQLQKAGE